MTITQQDMLDRLKEYPLINDLFSRSLTERQEGNWFRNIIIRSLYRNPVAIKDFENILAIIFERVENINLITSKLVGIEKEFDQKVWHVYAEILASKWFVDKGFEYIKFMETSDKPCPDIELRSKDRKTHFAEVKYLELTADELTPILSQLEQLATEYPNIYENKTFTIDVQTPYVAQLKRIRDVKKQDRQIDELMKNFHKKVISERKKLESTLTAGEQYNINIETPLQTNFEIKKSDSFRALLHEPKVYNFRITTGTEFFHYGPLYAKLIGRIHEAYLQLLTNRNDDFDLVRNDFVYLYIEKRGTDLLYFEKIKPKIIQMLEVLGINEVVQLVTNDEKILMFNEQFCPMFHKVET
ncbi:MAG: hypothetical protein ACFFCM_21555 [Promethearchaeota archaeon]